MTAATNQPVPLFDSIREIKTQRFHDIYSVPFAEDDFFVMKLFLLQYDGSVDTFNTYRRECERLAQWAWLIAKKSVQRLKRADIEQYLKFCQNPPKRWIGTKKVHRYVTRQGGRRPNPEWCLFVATLKKNKIKQGESPSINNYHFSQKALQSVFSSLNSFYNFLICENLNDINPITQIRQKSKLIRKQSSKRLVRRLTHLQWEFVIETAEKMARKNALIHERTLFVMSTLYLMYLRVSELASNARWQPKMGHFYKDSSESWWFKTVGKGNKERDIAVSDTMLKALIRYRQYLNLSPDLPMAEESTPLVHKNRGNGAVESSRHIRKIVQDCFDEAVALMEKEGFFDDAKNLEEATAHWLRHTGISDDINKRQRPMIHVRDDAGHASSATTDLYNDAEHQARHKSGKGKSLLPDE